MQVEDIEQFITLTDYSKYAVSNFGNVKNIKTNRILKGAIDNKGYKRVTLKLKENHKLHKLVASVFLDNPENKRCIDHIDSNRLNITISNLRWASHKENNRNRSLSKKNTSGVKGVYYNSKSNNWQSQIKILGTVIPLLSREI